MSAIYMSQLSTALPLMDQGDHQDHRHHHQAHFQAFTLPKDPPILFPFVISNSSASESSLSYGSAADHHHHHLLRQHHQAMLEPQHMIGGSSAGTASSVFATPFPTVESIRDDMIEPASYDPYDIGKLSMDACSWTPPAAKMRITRKATADPAAAAGKKPRRRAQAAGYEDVNMSGQPNLGVIRVCSDCNTTKTPLWRSGPCGPKSLCNACGIRQRKARRAMMAAAAGGGSGPVTMPTDSGKASPGNAAVAGAGAAHHKVKKEKRSVDVDRSLPFKKRCKVVQQDHHGAAAAAVAAPAAATDGSGSVAQAAKAEAGDDAACRPSRDLLVDDIGGLISWSRSPAAAPAASAASAASCSIRAASPAVTVQQDEITDAAMLLMTLSCGLVRS